MGCFGDVLGFRGALTIKHLLHNATLHYDCLYRHYNQGESHNICGETNCFTLQHCSKTQTLVGI